MLLVAAPQHGELLRAYETGAGEGNDVGVEGQHDTAADLAIQQRIHFREPCSVAGGQMIAVVDVFAEVFHPAIPGLVADGVGEHSCHQSTVRGLVKSRLPVRTGSNIGPWGRPSAPVTRSFSATPF